jgi:putative FmdB family regulatory protein
MGTPPQERCAEWDTGEVEETFPSGFESTHDREAPCRPTARSASDGEALARRGKRRAPAGCLFVVTPHLHNEPATSMPLYEYVCRKCHKKFGEVLTLKEHDSKKVHCPKCKSTDLEKVIEPFFAKTVSKTHGY